MRRELHEAFVVLFVVTVVGALCSYVALAVDGKGGKEQATLQEQGVVPQGLVSEDHPHPEIDEEISTGQWTFYAYGLGGVITLFGIWLKFKLSRRMHRLRAEAEANKNRSVM